MHEPSWEIIVIIAPIAIPICVYSICFLDIRNLEGMARGLGESGMTMLESWCPGIPPAKYRDVVWYAKGICR